MKIKKGDNVIVLAGKSKGQKGKVTKVIPETNRVVVEGVNKVKRHIRAKTRTEKGSLVEVEASLNASNIALLDAKTGKQTRIGYRGAGKDKVRFAKASSQDIK